MLRNQKLSNDLGLDTISDKLDEMYGILSIINDEIYSKTSSMDFDQGELDAIDERLMELRSAARKYRISTAELPEFYHNIQEKVSTFSNIEDLIADKEIQSNKAKEAYLDAAYKLSDLRSAYSKSLEIAILNELKDLKMDKIEFIIDIKPDENHISEKGIDKVTFLMRPNLGANISSISDALSGGELSRFILAATIIIATDSTATMIFDEIDTGVGGPTAYAIGKKLYALSKKHQVMVVTHQPQVACFANDHYYISKYTNETQTFTTLKHLEIYEKSTELARMMSGDRISAEAQKAADKLLKDVNEMDVIG